MVGMRSRLLALLTIALLTGCGPLSGEPADPDSTRAPGKVRVWHDDQRRVTCWIIKEGYSGGMSCLPDSEVGP